MDALLFAVRDKIRNLGFGYDAKSCDIVGPDGKPPPRCGQFYVSVFEGSTTNSAENNLDERFGFNIALTMRVTVPLDRVGDQSWASRVIRTPGPTGAPSFNARLEQLRANLHMNWAMTVLTSQTPASANDNLAAWAPSNVTSTYSFVEPARFRGWSKPDFVTGDWFRATPEAMDMGIVAIGRFDGCRRMQPQTASVGPFL